MAALRGVRVSFGDEAQLLSITPTPHNLIVLTLERLQRLSATSERALEKLLRAGGTLYVRGAPAERTHICLPGFLGSGFFGLPAAEMQSHNFPAHKLLPSVLRVEHSEGPFSSGGSPDLQPPYEPLMYAKALNNEPLAVLFAYNYCEGCAIFDLTSDAGTDVSPLLLRLADPAGRARHLGALISIDRAVGRDFDWPVAFNLTIDDRPIDYDYFSLSSLRRLFEHANDVLPGVHLDFSWTPSHRHPTRSYVELLKRFGSGFLWHGFARHVPHDLTMNFEREIATGRKLVREIEERYKVCFQPIMIFPFERSSAGALGKLAAAGLHAVGVSLFAYNELFTGVPSYLNYSIVRRLYADDGPLVLRRWSLWRFYNDLLLAHGVLGLPIMLTAHPGYFGLKRLPRPWQSNRIDDLDRVLRFAAAKRLRPRSMEQIAIEVGTSQRPL